MKTLFSIIIPVYKNEANLPITLPYIIEHLDLFPTYDIELILICDGSPDDSYKLMRDFRDRYPKLIKIVEFTRNFGQGAAIHCGMEEASGDVIGIISADLQDPFELFADMLAEWEKGFHLVIATRERRNEKGASKIFSKLMHHFIHKFVNSKYPEGGFDFFVVDKLLAKQFLTIDILNGGMQLRLLWFGYKYKEIKYTRQERKIGKSSWSIAKKINTAISWIVTFSAFPIRMFTVLGMIFFSLGIIGLLVLTIMIVAGFITSQNIKLISIIIGLFMFFTGILLCCMGVLGEYLLKMFEVLKGYPRYIREEEKK